MGVREQNRVDRSVPQLRVGRMADEVRESRPQHGIGQDADAVELEQRRAVPEPGQLDRHGSPVRRRPRPGPAAPPAARPRRPWRAARRAPSPEGAERLDRLVRRDLLDDQEQRRGSRLHEVAHLLLELAVEPRPLELPHDGPETGAERHAEDGHEEEHPEEQAPEAAPRRPSRNRVVIRDDLVGALPVTRNGRDGVRPDDQLARQPLRLVRRPEGRGLVRIPDRDQIPTLPLS